MVHHHILLLIIDLIQHLASPLPRLLHSSASNSRFLSLRPTTLTNSHRDRVCRILNPSQTHSSTYSSQILIQQNPQPTKPPTSPSFAHLSLFPNPIFSLAPDPTLRKPRLTRQTKTHRFPSPSQPPHTNLTTPCFWYNLSCPLQG